jgi:hypothetical protein
MSNKTRTLNELRQLKTYGYTPSAESSQSTEALIARHKTKLSSEPRSKKSKYNRRRAIDCTLIGRSKNNPGYCKYMITIAELDGTIHKQPAYGKDMQGALSRLINRERSLVLESNIGAGTMFLMWMVFMGVPAIYMNHYNSPVYILYGFLCIGLVIGVVCWWNTYVNRGR